jgi:hypothetical protein
MRTWGETHMGRHESGLATEVLISRKKDAPVSHRQLLNGEPS